MFDISNLKILKNSATFTESSKKNVVHFVDYVSYNKAYNYCKKTLKNMKN